ncbi:hypothetical protein O1611_g6149 [Lasiodiplodia mahajangana]|uniref:Uncharacterized protein n=1 Tax=Lasiodiplodia mahajangana TaxID=1108764 RepID=A0ACC2JJD6_9PEZI|nr:hypothetical protein O1611_g6149 [Lasiodiplodia mahajangana]
MDFGSDNPTTLQDLLEEPQLDSVAGVRSHLLHMQFNIEKLRSQLSDICSHVNHLLQDLCERDGRFLYLQDALVEFLDGDLGLRGRLGRQSQHINLALSVRGSANLMKLELVKNSRTLKSQDINYKFNFKLAAFEILSCVAFEILDVFDLDITIEESMVPYEISAYAALLDRLYHETSNLRSIKNDGIPEALSYVWGTEMPRENIFVDLQIFPVTGNLFEILRSLRHPNTARTIWIDAICINQSDSDEKTRQVRLMRDIYSQTQKTVIYLTEGDLQQRLRRSKYFLSIPPNFGGTTMDQYDLASILTEFHKHPRDSPWSHTQLALYIMLVVCTKEIVSHVWWERIWTLQEGALPPSAPVIYHRGHSFTLDELETSITIWKDVGEWTREKIDYMLGQVSETPAGNGVLSTLRLAEGLSLTGLPFLCKLHQDRKDDWEHSDFGSSTFFKFLSATGTYRATNPRDKIYALESLLPRCIGKLIRIDYNEGYEKVFACATARCINTTSTLALAGKFSLLIERKTGNNVYPSTADSEEYSAPSWALDFSYCSSSVHTAKLAEAATDLVTLDGFLFEQSVKYKKALDESGHLTVFATPRTLFCSGQHIDRVRDTGRIPEIESRNLFFEIFWLAFDIQKRLPSRLRADNASSLSSDHYKAALRLLIFFSLQLDNPIPTEE